MRCPFERVGRSGSTAWPRAERSEGVSRTRPAAGVARCKRSPLQAPGVWGWNPHNRHLTRQVLGGTDDSIGCYLNDVAARAMMDGKDEQKWGANHARRASRSAKPTLDPGAVSRSAGPCSYELHSRGCALCVMCHTPISTHQAKDKPTLEGLIHRTGLTHRIEGLHSHHVTLVPNSAHKQGKSPTEHALTRSLSFA